MAGDEGRRAQVPVRRAKPLHLPGLEGLDLSSIDWKAEPTFTVDEMEARMATLRRRVRGRLAGWREAVDRWWRRRQQARQRTSQGWTDGDVWTLDEHLCQHLGSLLVEHAQGAKSYPEDLTHPEWIEQVRFAGQRLLAYDPYDEARVADARSALRWVADNLVDLWD